MTPQQWEQLLSTLAGDSHEPLPVGFIIDSPWLPNWAGQTILDYYTSETVWMKANLKAIEQFPEVMFLPGFWSEFGMCTEPSAFGAKCLWDEDDFPFADKVIADPEQMGTIPRPDPRKDGLLPFMIKRLAHTQEAIAEAGHHIRFAAARGPWNICTFLMGTTEFMMALKTHPDQAHALLNTVTDFLVDWIQVQAKAFPTIDGILLLDDPVGFCGDGDFKELALPYLKRAFAAIDAKVRFFHNDARGLVCAPYLPEIGVNLFNFSFEHSLGEMKELTGNQVTLLGNIPARDVLAQGTPDDVRAAVRGALDSVSDSSRIILSAGGGMPPGVPTANLEAFLAEAGYKR